MTKPMLKVTKTAPTKPAQAQPCNGCGFCCAAEVCQAGDLAGATSAPCEFMTFDDGRFWCFLVLTEKMAGMDPLIADALGVGGGCTVEDFGLAGNPEGGR